MTRGMSSMELSIHGLLSYLNRARHSLQTCDIVYTRERVHPCSNCVTHFGSLL